MAIVEQAPPYVAEVSDALAWVDEQVDGTERQGRATHWHLTYSEISLNAPDRFAAERWDRLRRQPQAVAHTPHDAMRWLVEQECKAVANAPRPEAVAKMRGFHTEADWRLLHEVSWETLTTRRHRYPSGSGICTRDGWSVEIYANPMTGNCCR